MQRKEMRNQLSTVKAGLNRQNLCNANSYGVGTVDKRENHGFRTIVGKDGIRREVLRLAAGRTSQKYLSSSATPQRRNTDVWLSFPASSDNEIVKAAKNR